MNKVIAEIVSLSAYEAQVSALLTEDERMAMSSSSPARPKIIRSYRVPVLFARPDGLHEAEERAAVFVWSIS